MYLLRVCNCILFCGIIFSGCKSLGALTPDEAFRDLQVAYKNTRPDAVVAMLSKESIRKFRRISTMIAAMPEKQQQSLSRLYGIPPEKMMGLTAKDFISLNMKQGADNNVIRKALSYNIIEIKRDRHVAIVQVENGMELRFVKEGPYWKFDMTDL